MMTYTQPEAIIIQWIVLLLALVVGLRELWLLRSGKRAWWPLHSSRVPSLPLPWLWVSAFLAGVLGLVMIGLNLFALVLGALTIFWLVRRTGRSPERLWQFNSTRWGEAFQTGVHCYLATLIPISLITLFSLFLIHSLGGNAETQQAVQLFIEAEGIIEVVSLCILAVLVAPIIEEFIYRGFLYPIIKYHLGRGLALGMTSILFGISHAHWLSILPLTALGVVLALLYDQTGRLGYPILLHSVFNSVTCAVILVELYAG